MNSISLPLPLVQTIRLHKHFKEKTRSLRALNDINLEIQPGETLGLVGESGCGKSTIGKILLGLENPSSGSVIFGRRSISDFSKKELFAFRRKAQMIFQDPYASLNPRLNVEEIVGEGLDIHHLATGMARRKLIAQALNEVGFDNEVLKRFPHEFSGGQRQRIVIARAMIINPLFIVCDEPISSLDRQTQKQIMALLVKLKQERLLTYLFISHDMHAVREISDRIAVMYLGEIVEQCSKDQLFTNPLHPYTQALLSAVPIADPKRERDRLRIILNGEMPSPYQPPGGCPFHPRCPQAMSICKAVNPGLVERTPGHLVACHLVKE